MTEAAMNSAALFYPPDYRSSREQFRSLAAARGFRLESHPIGVAGPHAEELTVDVALGGAEAPSRVVVVSSGLHGVEGFFGAAVQAALMENVLTAWTPPEGAAVVLIHALDPFGFAWVRRTNEENIDLNRNFLIHGAPYRGAPAQYRDLNALLNPSHPPSLWDLFLPRAVLAVARSGMANLKQAVAEGQYEYPKGLFFGGRGPSRVYKLVSEHMPRWIGEAETIVHIDFHTGLGRWATYKLLLEGDIPPSRVVKFRQWFGADSVQWSEPTGIAYRTRGGLGTWCQSQFIDRSYSFLCAEFGTYGPLAVMAALRYENQAHFWGRPRDTRLAKRRLMEAFAPSDPWWRETSLRKGVRIVTTAFSAVFGTDEALTLAESPQEPTGSPGSTGLPGPG
jgi:hypothetical protein